MVRDHRYRILLVIRWPIGGIRTFMRYVYRYFDPSRYHFTILAPEGSELRVLLDDLKSLEVSYIPIKRSCSTSEFAKVVFRTVINGKYDLVHSHGLTAGICSILPSLISRSPHILTVHEALTGKDFEVFKGQLKKCALSLLLPFIEIIHSVSQDAQENLLDYVFSLKMFKRKLVVIPNGVEVERFLHTDRRDLRKELNLPNNTFLIGFLGRFMPEKGFVYLIDALDLLYRKYDLPKQPFVLTFGEEDGFIREGKKYVREKGIEKSVYFMPFAPNIAPTLKGLDIVVMPSLWEACGLLAMEAMVAGVPVIGTDCIGLRETLRDTPSVMVPAKNSAALADALLREMNCPSKRKAETFRKEAARRFDVTKQAKELERVTINLLD